MIGLHQTYIEWDRMIAEAARRDTEGKWAYTLGEMYDHGECHTPDCLARILPKVREALEAGHYRKAARICDAEGAKCWKEHRKGC